MCNLYSNTTTQQAMRQLFTGIRDVAGNLASSRVYPDQSGAIVRRNGAGLELAKARWGLPSPPSVLKTARDPGVTNVRNLASPHWRRWLGQEHRCLVPLTAFAEPLGKGRGNQWFAPDEEGRTLFFAGIEVRGWTSVRKVREGETTDDLYGFLTCAPNAEVKAIHPKAMPVILAGPHDWTAWLEGADAAGMQRPLPDGSLRLVEGDS